MGLFSQILALLHLGLTLAPYGHNRVLRVGGCVFKWVMVLKETQPSGLIIYGGLR